MLKQIINTTLLTSRILIWDNDGTIMGSKNPHDTASTAKIILPNIAPLIQQENTFNIICSGCKTPESELQNFDPEAIIAKFKRLMQQLPISIATFSPAIGGTQCYVIIKKEDTTFEIRQAHEDTRYQAFVGQFKKPSIGMLVVIQDLLKEFGIVSNRSNAVMIGDTWHDQAAAHSIGIPFIDAHKIHQLPFIAPDYDIRSLAESTPISIQEITHNENTIETARTIFINYFTNLYKGIPPAILGITSSTEQYLNHIFATTKTAIAQHQLFAFLAYINNTAVGFLTCMPLEKTNIILVRTLPIALAYKDKELMIRNALLEHIRTKFPNHRHIAMMVRKANSVQASLCIENGFQLSNTIFQDTDFIRKAYDSNWYHGYILKLHNAYV